MTDSNSDINSPTPSLNRTVRRSEIINHLTNFRVEVDRAIHALPGVMLGVSFAGIIQAALHLTSHIEHVRGHLVAAMLREGYNPLGEGDIRNYPPQSPNATPAHTPARGPELTRTYGRDQGYTYPIGEYPGAAGHQVDYYPNPGTSRNVVHNRSSTTIPASNSVNTRGDQIVPEQRISGNPRSQANYVEYPTQLSQGNVSTHSMARPLQVPPDRAMSEDNSSHYSTEAVHSQGNADYDAPPGEYQ